MKDRHVDTDAAAVIASIAYHGDDQRIREAREIAQACVGVTHDDRCLAAHAIFECAMESAKVLGYPNGIL